MIGTIEIFELSTGNLVYSDGFAARMRPIVSSEFVGYIVIRRLGPKIVPHAVVMGLIFDELLDWLTDDNQSTFDISTADLNFLETGQL